MSPSSAISVVVPFFNSEQHIGSCIESLLDQRGVDGSYELIFVNNGSTDASASIVEQATEIISLSEATPGAYAARNTGIREATAPVVAFTDADCRVDRDWLRSIQSAMQEPSVAAVVGHVRYPPRASWVLHMLSAYENAKIDYVLGQCEPDRHFAYANNMAVRAAVLEELGGFKEWERAADTELVHRLAAHHPDLRTIYRRSMRVTHLEFVSAWERLRRLRLYANTNSQVDSFQELTFAQRVAAIGRVFRRK
jgi:glycosyltransferase involved in cell wall biosynthesis